MLRVSNSIGGACRGCCAGGGTRKRWSTQTSYAVTSLAAYQALRDEKLAALPGVQRLTSTIVMKRVVEDRPYPT